MSSRRQRYERSRAAFECATTGYSDFGRMMDFYDAARRCGDAVMEQVKDVMNGEGDDVNVNAIKRAMQEFRKFPEIVKVLEAQYRDVMGQ